MRTDSLPTFALNPGIAFSKTIRVGSDVSGTFDPWDLTGYTIASSAVEISDDEDAPEKDQGKVCDFTVTIPLPQTSTTEGKFTLSLTAEETEALTAFERAYFDVIFTDTGGTVSVYPLGFLIYQPTATEPA